MSALPELPLYIHLLMNKYNIHDGDYLYKIMREYGVARAAHARKQERADIIEELEGMICNSATARSAIKLCIETIKEMK